MKIRTVALRAVYRIGPGIVRRGAPLPPARASLVFRYLRRARCVSSRRDIDSHS